MKKFKRHLKSVSVVMAGATIASLWLTNTDNWRVYFPLCLISLALESYLNDTY